MTNIPCDNFNRFLIIILIISTFLLSFSIVYIITLKKWNNKLSKDSLTSLPNRFNFNLFCERNKYLTGFALVINLDNFKKINNLYTYHIGDKITEQASNYLKKSNNNIFKISEDKFMIFIKDENKLNDFLKNLELDAVTCKLLKKYGINLSVGIFNKKNSNMYLAFRYADFAMHKAKNEDGFSKFYANSQFIKEKELENNIETILRGNLKQLFCLYQPKLNLIKNKCEEYESLARINFNGETISPNIFIPLAEKLNLIYKIDYKVAEINISLISKLIKQNILSNDIKISFNISLNTLERSDFISTITNLLKKYKLSGKYIEIEITESIISKNFDLLLEKVTQLQNLKIDISLDDFTTGFSSSQLLALVPLQKIKLDKSLLDNYKTKKGRSIYINLLNLIKSLEIDIVAEGVETDEQLIFLKKHNVTYIQGYLISKPDFLNKFLYKK